MFYVIALAALASVCDGEGGKPKKKKSDYTQADWDRVAREWEREEIEEEEQELKKARKGLKFDPNGDADFMFAQVNQGKPTMIFFTLRESYCPNTKSLENISSRFASMLLNGHVPVQTYPVSERRSIFMTKNGMQSIQIKNFLLAQPEVENVSIDNRVYTPEHGKNPLDPDSTEKLLKKASGVQDSDVKASDVKASDVKASGSQGSDVLRKAPDFEHDVDTGMLDMEKYKDMKNPPKILSDEEIGQEDPDFMEEEEEVKSRPTSHHDNRPNIQPKTIKSANDIPEIHSEL